MTQSRSDNLEFKNYDDPLGRRIGLVREEGVLARIRESAFRTPFEITAETSVMAIVGDAHGHFLCALHWLAEWIQYSGRDLDLILQVGDITDDTVNASPTSRTYRGLPSDLGLEDLMPQSEKLASFYRSNPKLASVPVGFIAGNHDIEAIEGMFERENGENPFHPNFYFLPNGSTTTAYNFQSINTAMRLKPSLKISSLGWDSTPQECKAVRAAKPDILLSHTATSPHGRASYASLTKGFHFFGHHPEALQMSDRGKQSFGLEHVAPVNKGHRLGSVGVLFLNEEGSKNEDSGLFLYLPTD